MSEPSVPLPPAPKGEPPIKGWAKKAVPGDPVVAGKRVRRARAGRRRRIEPVVFHSVRLRAGLSEVVEDLADRYEVAKLALFRRFVEDGIRRYGSDADLEKCGLALPKDNPFDPITPNVRQRDVVPEAEFSAEEYLTQTPAVVVPGMVPTVSGAPLPYKAEVE